MQITNKKAEKVKIAYIGGGSRGWARGLMSDLAAESRMCGKVYLYDIDYSAAKDNEKIGNMYKELPDCASKWDYIAVKTREEALKDADFVVISILPGTFDQMETDVHVPEEYGIYQSVGDSVGPGGAVRALRTIPMYVEIANDIKKYCPDAWVINYTNPMTVCTRTLYEVFPEIKAFGCCHEVFATQEFIANVYNSINGTAIDRYDISVNIFGVNHFTWVDAAHYNNIDLMPMMKKYAEENKDGKAFTTLNWMNKNFATNQTVKLDLYRRYGILAAAGDRHLAEFCPGAWYLKDPDTVAKYNFALTSVKWRKEDLKERLRKARAIISGEEPLKIEKTGEEGVNQMVALTGIAPYVTNVNIPNIGQIENLPKGAVVETNAYFSGDSVRPVCAGRIPDDVNHLVIRHVYNQERIVKSGVKGDYEGVFRAFINDPNVVIGLDKARELFDKMLEKTKDYLPFYEKYKAEEKSFI